MVSCVIHKVYMYSIRYNCQILMKLEFSRQMLEKSSNIKFRENPSRGDPSCSMRTNRETDKNYEAHGHFS